METNNASLKFLEHLLILLKEKMDNLTPISKASSDFEAGRSMGYHEVSDLVMECSRLFNIQLTDFGVKDFDPDKLL